MAWEGGAEKDGLGARRRRRGLGVTGSEMAGRDWRGEEKVGSEAVVAARTLCGGGDSGDGE